MWPNGCTQSELTLNDGTSIYYDLKVTVNATMGYGLYTDARCEYEYDGNEVTLQQVTKGNDYLLSQENLEYWNEAMEVYKVCQPCRAYALQEGGKHYGGNDNDNNKNNNNNDENDDYYFDPNNGNFECYDMADYTNVNQCMKFKTKTILEPVSTQRKL